jgi:nucleotide-binding universal stress UspA family protein
MEIKAKHEAAETLFTKKAADQGFQLVDKASLGATRTAKWVYMAGSLDTLFSSIGRTADVSVVSRPTKTAKGPGSDFMLAALLETGKPIIVLPKTPAESLGRRVLIAWNQGVEAARAVAAALPLLQQAESVHIVSSGSESRPGAKAAVLVEYLKYWGVKATHNRTKGRDPAVEIMDAFRNQGSDLIVMGAYSRGRVRETVFGGVTEDLLFGSPLPVFALHS